MVNSFSYPEIISKRQGKVGKIWFVDETYILVKGNWCYLYRGIDENGNLVDARLSEKRDMEAALAFFAQAHEIVEAVPERVVTDGHTSYPRAIAEELGTEVEHEVRSCLGNPIDQSHRGIKQRYYPTLGFGVFESAKRFSQADEEVRQFLRPRERMAEFVSLSERREPPLQSAPNCYIVEPSQLQFFPVEEIATIDHHRVVH